MSCLSFESVQVVMIEIIIKSTRAGIYICLQHTYMICNRYNRKFVTKKVIVVLPSYPKQFELLTFEVVEIIMSPVMH